ncbi:MAG: NAD(P)H-dependent oxidoreductase [Thermoleophilia bacterium]|nr:NAD(P)H-dependent oxidoreductase [Thermoleophilia bacterium]
MLGHPQRESLCGAIADAYAQGARDAGHEVRLLALGDLDFDPIRRTGYGKAPELEPDLVRAQQDIAWCDHMAWVYPNWWGTMPALMKGFIDRAILPGFAFKYHEGKLLWEKLLKGRSARLLVTMDTPSLWYRWVVGRPGHNQMRHSVLGFCGVKPVRVSQFGVVKKSSPTTREAWLRRATDLGAAAP